MPGCAGEDCTTGRVQLLSLSLFSLIFYSTSISPSPVRHRRFVATPERVTENGRYFWRRGPTGDTPVAQPVVDIWWTVSTLSASKRTQLMEDKSASELHVPESLKYYADHRPRVINHFWPITRGKCLEICLLGTGYVLVGFGAFGIETHPTRGG